MILIREHFVAKPGNAGKLAGMLKEVSALAWPGKGRVTTDLTREFNRVILETEAETLSEFDERLKEYGSNPEWKKKMAGYTDLWTTGGREIFRVL
jgi:hypothetical protein